MSKETFEAFERVREALKEREGMLQSRFDHAYSELHLSSLASQGKMNRLVNSRRYDHHETVNALNLLDRLCLQLQDPAIGSYMPQDSDDAP